MDREKVGIKETKEVIVFLIAAIKAVVSIGLKGSFAPWDLIALVSPLRLLGPALRDSHKLRQEIADLSEAEKAELCDLVASELKLDNKTVQEYLVKIIQALLSFLDLVPLMDKTAA